MGTSGSKHLTDSELIEKSLRKALKKSGRNTDCKLTKNDMRDLFLLAFDLELTDYETRVLFSLVNRDSSGKIYFEQFIKIACAHKDARFEFDIRKFCRNIFDDIDKDKNGQISLEEFKEASELLPGILKLFKSNRSGKISKREFEILFNSKFSFNEKEMELFFYSLDFDSNEHIDFNEFLKLLKHDFEIDDSLYGKILFNMFDKNKDGSISLEEYVLMIRMDPNSDLTNEEIKSDFEDIDVDHDGKITLQELLKSINE